jgi:hypothetical protein
VLEGTVSTCLRDLCGPLYLCGSLWPTSLKGTIIISKKFDRESSYPYLCRPEKGSLAQLVQSICLTSRGSAVRTRQLPRKRPLEYFYNSVLEVFCLFYFPIVSPTILE